MLTNVFLSGDPVHDRVLRAFYDGCPTDKKLYRVDEYEPCDVAVVFGVGKRAVPFSQHRANVLAEQKLGRRKCIVLETGYINRGDGETNHYAAGFGGLNGRADFRNQNSQLDRLEKLFEFERWPSRRIQSGDVILLCGQVPWDASVEDSYHEIWIRETWEKLQNRRRPVMFRPHPKAPQSLFPDLPKYEKPVNWDEIYAVVTYNSNIAVEAVWNDVHAFADDIGSMALPLAERHLSRMACMRGHAENQRIQWAANLAYAQWTPDEMRKGLAWEHLLGS